MTSLRLQIRAGEKNQGGNMVKRARSLILMLFCVLTVLGCTSSQEPKIIGKWVCKVTGDRMELSADHTCMVYSIGFHYMGRWTVSKSDIKVEAGQIVLKGSFDGKSIVAEDALMHNKYTFEKVVGSES